MHQPKHILLAKASTVLLHKASQCIADTYIFNQGEAKVQLAELRAGTASVGFPPNAAAAPRLAAKLADVPVVTASRCSLLEASDARLDIIALMSNAIM